MFKKRLVTLVTAVSLAVTPFSGVLAEPSVAEASNIYEITSTDLVDLDTVKTIKITDKDLYSLRDKSEYVCLKDYLGTEYDCSCYSNDYIFHNNELSVFFYEIRTGEYPNYSRFYVLRVVEVPNTNEQLVYIIDENDLDEPFVVECNSEKYGYKKFLVKYDEGFIEKFHGRDLGTEDSIVSREKEEQASEEEKERREEEEAKNLKKRLRNIIVANKTVKISSVSLTSPEKKGVIVIKKGNLKEAAKFHKMLKSKKVSKVKVKASSEKKADKIYKKLCKNVGYVNTYGFCNIRDWYGGDIQEPKKKGSYYILKIDSYAKRDLKDYNYGLKVFKRVWSSYKKCFKSAGYELPSNVHFCDLSEASRVYAVPFIYRSVFGTNSSASQGKNLSNWRLLAGNKGYICNNGFLCTLDIALSLGLDMSVYLEDTGIMRYSTHTKIKFRDNNDNKTVKIKDPNFHTYSFDWYYYRNSSTDIKTLRSIGLESELLKLK